MNGRGRIAEMRTGFIEHSARGVQAHGKTARKPRRQFLCESPGPAPGIDDALVALELEPRENGSAP